MTSTGPTESSDTTSNVTNFSKVTTTISKTSETPTTTKEVITEITSDNTNPIGNFFSTLTKSLNNPNVKKGIGAMIGKLEGIHVKKNHPDAKIPDKAHESDAGFDLYSVEDVIVPSWGKAVVDIGISIKLCEDTAGLIWSRSGLSVKNDIEVGAGVIDENYTGPIKVVLRNFSDIDYKVSKGDKIAQMLVQRSLKYQNMVEVDSLELTDRGSDGFGSSDVSKEITNTKVETTDGTANDDLVFTQSTKITVDGKTKEKVTETKFEDIFANLFKVFTGDSSSKSLKEPVKTYTTTDPKTYPVTEWWDDEKTVVKTSRTYEGDVLVKIINYWENSNKKSEENYDATGTEYHGPYLEYYPNGNIKLSCNYSEGYLVDTETEYDESGHIVNTKTHKHSK